MIPVVLSEELHITQVHAKVKMLETPLLELPLKL